MQNSPDLKPKTKEIWAGIRSAGSASSELQDEINRIRARLSGIVSYQEFLEPLTQFAGWESALETEADACGTITADEVEGTIVAPVESNFASFSDYTGDKSNGTGVYAQNSYDAYRTYLTNNGLSSIDADQHIQAVQGLFGSDNTFLDRINEFGSYSELDTWLTNNGWTDDEAQALIDDLKAKYSWSQLETAVQGACDLSQLLNKYDHEGGRGAGTEVDGNGVLYLRGTEIRMQQIAADQTSDDKGGSVSWTLSTGNQTMTLGDTLALPADGSSSQTDTFDTGVSLVVNGTVIETTTVTVTNGTTSVIFGYSPGSAGEKTVQIGNSSTITVTVQPA